METAGTFVYQQQIWFFFAYSGLVELWQITTGELPYDKDTTTFDWITTGNHSCKYSIKFTCEFFVMKKKVADIFTYV